MYNNHNMLFPLKKPEYTTLKSLVYLTMSLLVSESLLVFTVYAMYFQIFDKPIILFMISLYSIIFVYCIGFIIDNSPLLGVTSLFTSYVIIYNLGIREYFTIIITLFIICIFIAAYIKDVYSHTINNRKPVLLNIFLYTLISFCFHVIPFHIYHQNSYYRDISSGLLML